MLTVAKFAAAVLAVLATAVLSDAWLEAAAIDKVLLVVVTLFCSWFLTVVMLV